MSTHLLAPVVYITSENPHLCCVALLVECDQPTAVCSWSLSRWVLEVASVSCSAANTYICTMYIHSHWSLCTHMCTHTHIWYHIHTHTHTYRCSHTCVVSANSSKRCSTCAYGSLCDHCQSGLVTKGRKKGFTSPITATYVFCSAHSNNQTLHSALWTSYMCT